MKKKFFTTEFVVIVLFFVLPPIVFTPALNTERVVQFSWQTFVLAALAAALWWQLKYTVGADSLHNDPKVSERRLRFLLNQGQCLLTFGLLTVVAGVFEMIGRFIFPSDAAINLLAPTTIIDWANVLLGTLCAAFYEEVLYRAYVPDAMTVVFVRKNDAHAAQKTYLCEAAAVILFALAHRYAGWLSVLNALVAGAVLRRCYRKTSALWTTVVAHTAYNALMLAVSFAR